MEDDFVVLFTFLGPSKRLEICAADLSFLPVVARALAVVAEGRGLITGAGAGAGVGVLECSKLESHGTGGGGRLVVEGREEAFEEEGAGSSFCLESFPW